MHIPDGLDGYNLGLGAIIIYGLWGLVKFLWKIYSNSNQALIDEKDKRIESLIKENDELQNEVRDLNKQFPELLKEVNSALSSYKDTIMLLTGINRPPNPTSPVIGGTPGAS